MGTVAIWRIGSASTFGIAFVVGAADVVLADAVTFL
jgi:hypothetical protein